MRNIVLITSLAFIAGLFAAGTVIGAGESQKQMGTSQMGETQQQQQQRGVMQQEGMQQQQMAAQQLNQEQIRELQNILNERGFNSGSADGIMGPKTREALRQFQKTEGLAASGRPDMQTLQALATDAETQELFGVSPKFEEQQQHPMQQQQQSPSGTSR